MSFEKECIFACKMLLSMKNASTENFLISPTSFLRVSTDAFIDTEEERAKEISKITGENKTKDEFMDCFSHVFQEHSSSNFNGISFINNLFVSKEFSDVIKIKFNRNIEYINFKEPTIAAQKMNTLLKISTKNRNQTVIKPENITTNTQSILVNSLYFSSPWNSFHFIKESEKTFYSNPTKTLNFLYMNVAPERRWNFIENNEWDALGIPYEGFKAWLFIILPKNGLSKLIEKMNAESFKEWTVRCPNQPLSVSIPKIEASYNFISTKEELKDLVEKEDFESYAHINQIIEDAFESAKIDYFIHTGTFKIDKEGTYAKGIHVEEEIIPLRQNFIVNRPFLYFVLTSDEHLTAGNNSKLLFVGTYC